MNHISNTRSNITGFDTLAVLFFLALEYGRGAQFLRVDAVFMGITMIMVIVLPFFLPTRVPKPDFPNWLLFRTAVAAVAVVIGLVVRQSTGVIIPDAARFLPMTFLILSAMASCYIQFYSLMRLRAVK